MAKNKINSIINLINEENLVEAQRIIKETLSNRLGNILDAKFEEYASSIFESKKSKKAKKDWDGDGKVESDKDEVWGSRKKAANKEGKWLNEDTYCEDGECEEDEMPKKKGKKSHKKEKEEEEEDEDDMNESWKKEEEEEEEEEEE